MAWHNRTLKMMRSDMTKLVGCCKSWLEHIDWTDTLISKSTVPWAFCSPVWLRWVIPPESAGVSLHSLCASFSSLLLVWCVQLDFWPLVPQLCEFAFCCTYSLLQFAVVLGELSTSGRFISEWFAALGGVGFCDVSPELCKSQCSKHAFSGTVSLIQFAVVLGELSSSGSFISECFAALDRVGFCDGSPELCESQHLQSQIIYLVYWLKLNLI